MLQIDQQQIDRTQQVEVSGLSEYFWRDHEQQAPRFSDPLEAMIAEEDGVVEDQT